MPAELYSDVVLTEDLPDAGLQRGDVGTVVELHHVGDNEGYSVEFFDMTGRTVAVETVRATQVRAPTGHDRPAIHSSG